MEGEKSKVEGERRRENSYRCYNCNMDTYGGWVKKKEERGLEIRTRSEAGESSDTWDRISIGVTIVTWIRMGEAQTPVGETRGNLERAIREAGREPGQRDTFYEPILS